MERVFPGIDTNGDGGGAGLPGHGMVLLCWIAPPACSLEGRGHGRSIPFPDGGLVGGLGGLLEKLQSAGHGETVKSWLGPGQNQPIEPGQLRSALGQKTVSDVAQRAGVSEQEFLSQLSQTLPQFVDKLTPSGRIPSLQEIAAALSQKQGMRVVSKLVRLDRVPTCLLQALRVGRLEVYSVRTLSV